MARRTSSKHQKDLYQRYKSEGRQAKNREARLLRHLSKFPDDKQAEKALTGNIEYRRKRPLAWNKVWKSEDRYFAQLFRKAGLNGNDALKPRNYMIIR